uniref:Uncharacterized protein n=1 Tax=Opuntia streptacantha TaxID=393608 RepID=A0A7C9D908_OPUST
MQLHGIGSGGCGETEVRSLGDDVTEIHPRHRHHRRVRHTRRRVHVVSELGHVNRERFSLSVVIYPHLVEHGPRRIERDVEFRERNSHVRFYSIDIQPDVVGIRVERPVFEGVELDSEYPIVRVSIGSGVRESEVLAGTPRRNGEIRRDNEG